MATLMQKDVLIEAIAATHAYLLKRCPTLDTSDALVNDLAQQVATLYKTPADAIPFESSMHKLIAIRDAWQSAPRLIDSMREDTYQNFMLDKIWDFITVHHPTPSHSTPVVYLLGGQPGAGKSQWMVTALEELHDQALVINGDMFRPYHRDYETLFAQYGQAAPQHTAGFASQMIEVTRNRALEENLSLILEGTFRTAHVPLGEVNRFKAQNYDIRIRIATCAKSLSWASTLERVRLQSEWGLEARHVSQAHHDVTCTNLPDCVANVIAIGHVTDVAVRDRHGIQIHQKGNVDPETIHHLISNLLG